jgi:hypothetical protein
MAEPEPERSGCLELIARLWLGAFVLIVITAAIL